MFLAPKPGPTYWFRNDPAETAEHLRRLQESEELARLAGINTRLKVDLTIIPDYTLGDDLEEL